MNLTRESSLHLKGIAILFVIISHLVPFLGLPEVFLELGGWGVTIFLVVSGFGLVSSFEQRGRIEFLKRRILKTVLPYSLLTSLLLISDLLFLSKSYPLKLVILALFGLNLKIYDGPDPSMWFITYIILWYALVFILFTFLPSNKARCAGLLVVSAVIYMFPSEDYVFFLWKSYALAFPVGVWLAMLSRKNLKPSNKLLYIGSVGCLIVSLYFIKTSIAQITVESQGMTSLFGALFLILAVSALQHSYWTSRLFSRIGTISLELYLFEMIFIDKYSLLILTPYKVLNLFIYVIGLYLVSSRFQLMLIWLYRAFGHLARPCDTRTRAIK